jgi:hypothetical protein
MRTLSPLHIGDSVAWVRACNYPRYQNIVGTILAVIPCDSKMAAFTMYDVQFTVGRFTLYGTKIEVALPPSAPTD